jgi:uncharacterized SAM-binding protein YcdF (DUF218 family)
MFVLKKIVSRFLFPLPLSLEFILVGLCLVWLTRRQRAGKILITFGAFLLTALSYPFASTPLVRVLERRYPAYVVPAARESPGASPTYIVVLGGRANRDPAVPVTSRISSDLLARLAEALRLHREIPGSKLILSGSSGSAEALSSVAQVFGASPQDILLTPEPRDTEEEALRISALVGKAPLILVTSATHMPRALGLFRKLGVHPQPAPADFLAPEYPPEPVDLFPSAFELFKSQTAIYEYMGLAWAKLRGKI